MRRTVSKATLYDGLERIDNAYARAVIAIWRDLVDEFGVQDELPFTKARLDDHGDELVKLGLGVAKKKKRKVRDESDSSVVKNRADIIYAFRARLDLPDEIQKHGHYAVLGRGKGRYAFVKIHRPNRLQIPNKVKVAKLRNKVPSWAAEHMRNDEQAMLVNIQLNDLVRDHLKLRAVSLLQHHSRLFVKDYGQVELDAVYIGETHAGKYVGIGVDAKPVKDDDRHNIAQLYGDGLALLRNIFPGMSCRMLAAKPTGDGAFYMCEFMASEDVLKISEVHKWKKYVMVNAPSRLDTR
jgi:hypothetical protein